MTSEPQVRSSTLSNGLRLVTVAMPHLHTATIAAYLRVGSRFESQEDNGLSHFVEHMLFRGCASHQSSLELNLAFENQGSSLHAETGRDHSLYQLSVEPEKLEPSLALLAEFLGTPRFDEIELERRLILEEVNEDYDEGGNEINGYDLARALMFKGNPLEQRIIGPRENVRRFATKDVRRHHETFYVARNMVLSVAGPLTHEEVEPLAVTHFSGLPAGEPSSCSTPGESIQGPLLTHVHESGSQTEIEMIWRGLPEQHELYLAQCAMLQVLDDGMASRLHYRLCDQQGLAYHLGAGIEPLHDLSLLEVSGSTANHKVAELLSQVLSLLQELRTDNVSDEELRRVKNRSHYELACMQDDPSAMVDWFGGTSLHHPPLDLSERSRRFDAISAAQIREVANLVLHPDRLAVALVGSLDRAQLEASRASLSAGAGTTST